MTIVANSGERSSSRLRSNYVFSLTQRATNSDAFLYPLFGVQHFRLHPEYWPSFAQLLIPLASIYIITLQILFVFLFPLYAFLATLVLGPVGIVQAIIIIFQVTTKITNLVLRVRFFSKLQARIFDQVLMENGYGSIVDEFRQFSGDATESSKNTLSNWFETKAWPSLMRLITLVVIAQIPLIGPFLCLYVRASYKATKVHERHHELARLSNTQRKLYFTVFERDYKAFGCMAIILETIPLFSFFFMLTSNVGMALWTVDNKEKLCAARNVSATM